MEKDVVRAVSLQHIEKQFSVQRGRPRSLLESIIAVARRQRASVDRELRALHDVTFDVARGECIGIVGRNGSGKSTLLKIIARILRPTSGRLEVRGRVSALLELGAGFHQDLTGRENIFLNASVLGLSQQEVESSFDSIVRFSELAEFIDMPVKHYSSGMYVRLGFSVAIHVNPDVLIVDEVLAVGDQAFRAKCMDRIRSMKRDGTTIIIISHNLELIEKLSDRVVWLDNGAVRMIGETDDVAHHYYEFMVEQEDNQLELQKQERTFERLGNGLVEVTGVRLLALDDVEQRFFSTGQAMRVEMRYQAHQRALDPVFVLGIYREDGTLISQQSTELGGRWSSAEASVGRVVWQADALPLLPARYHISISIRGRDDDELYDHHDQAYPFWVIEDPQEDAGLLPIQADWEWLPELEKAVTPK